MAGKKNIPVGDQRSNAGWMKAFLNAVTRVRLPAQLVVLVAFLATLIVLATAVPPDQVPARIVAGATAISFVVVGGLLASIEKFPMRQRGVLVIVTMVIALLAFGAFLWMIITVFVRGGEGMRRAYRDVPNVAAIVRGDPVGGCSPDPYGSAVQTFENGWLVAHFRTRTFYAIGRTSQSGLRWYKQPDSFIKGQSLPCTGVERESLLRLGFRWWYCDSKLVRDLLGLPVTRDTRAWTQFQSSTAGLFVWGLPTIPPGWENMEYQRIAGAFLETAAERTEGVGQWTQVDGGGTDQPIYCTALWYPIPAARQLHPRLLAKTDCAAKISPERYLAPSETCSIFGL